MFKFVADNVGGVGAKRKLGPKSCESCKKRHKRCPHWDQQIEARHSGVDDTPLLDAASSNDINASRAEATAHASADEASPQTQPEGARLLRPQPPQKPQDAYLRFVGDLSPEASFLLNRDAQNGDRSVSRHDLVGVWLGQKHDEQDPDASQIAEVSDASAAPGLILSSMQGLRPALRQECLSTLPPTYEFERLAELYFSKIDPIFPILHGDALENQNPLETVALKQCICLVASLDPSMRKYLRLPGTDRIFSQISFRARIAAVVKQSLDLGFMRDKMVLLQVCALMALYVDKPGCSEVSTYYVSQVVHLSQTLGLHLGWPGDTAKEEKARRIFWCVWVLDRLNAATNGRPVLMHLRDFDRRIINSLDDQVPPFQLLIRITQYLDDTISMYRPHARSPDEPAESETQTFEDLVEDTKTLEIPGGLLASLEMYFLSVVILRSRPRGRHGVTRSPSSELQVFCASTIISIASEEFKNAVSFWPILPYCVSMAASVAYKSLRNTKLPHHRKRAYVLFHSSCEVLDELSKAFLSARAVAKLATDTMQEVERVAGGRVKTGRPREVDIADSSTSRQPITNTDAESSQRSNQVYTNSRPTTEPIESNGQLQSPDQSWPVFSDRLMPIDMDYFNGFDGDNGIFGQFDPSFNLGRIDAIFSANLDPTVPHIPDDWL